MTALPTTLLIGGNSRLAVELLQRNPNYCYTTRRSSSDQNKNVSYLDLADPYSFSIPSSISQCVFIGGPTTYKDSIINFQSAYDIHSEMIPYLARIMLKRNIHVIYISSNMVFGSSDISRCETSWHSADIPYGFLKQVCERALRSLADELGLSSLLSIVRLTKHISPDTSPFDRWIDDIQNLKPISAFDDLYFSPITYSNSASLIESVLKKRSSGIFHMSNSCSISYYDFMSKYCSFLNNRSISTPPIIRTNSNEQGVKLQFTGTRSELEMTSTVHQHSLYPVSLEEIFMYYSSLLN